MKSESEVREGLAAAETADGQTYLQHKFESISEEEWKAGKSRYLCAACWRDYSDPIHERRIDVNK